MTGVWPAIAAGAVITALVMAVLAALAAWWGWDERRHSLRLRRRLRVVERHLAQAHQQLGDAERRIGIYRDWAEDAQHRLDTYRQWADGHIQLAVQPEPEDQEQ
jgi:hypothetical protein